MKRRAGRWWLVVVMLRVSLCSCYIDLMQKREVFFASAEIDELK